MIRVSVRVPGVVGREVDPQEVWVGVREEGVPGQSWVTLETLVREHHRVVERERMRSTSCSE